MPNNTVVGKEALQPIGVKIVREGNGGAQTSEMLVIDTVD